MLFVARIAEPEKGGNKIWTMIENSISNFSMAEVAPLYLSRRAEYLDTSLIASAASEKVFRNALQEILGISLDPKTVAIFPLIGMRLFNVPENIGKEASRFLITIRVKASKSEQLYRLLSSLRPSSDIAFTYLAFTSERPCDTLTLSAFAKSNDHLLRFVQQELKEISGIISINLMPITRSKRLMPYAEMVIVLKKELEDFTIPKPLLDLSDLTQ